MLATRRSRTLFYLIYLLVKSFFETICTFYHFFHIYQKTSFDVELNAYKTSEHKKVWLFDTRINVRSIQIFCKCFSFGKHMKQIFKKNPLNKRPLNFFKQSFSIWNILIEKRKESFVFSNCKVSFKLVLLAQF